jgi:protein TonB
MHGKPSHHVLLWLLSAGLHIGALWIGSTWLPTALSPVEPSSAVSISLLEHPIQAAAVKFSPSGNKIEAASRSIPKPRAPQKKPKPEKIKEVPAKEESLQYSTVPLTPADSSYESPPAMPSTEAREILPSQIYVGLPTDAIGVNQYVFPPTGYLDAFSVDRRIRAHQDLVPVYPPEAYDAGRPGRVVAEILVAETGRVDSIRIVLATDGFEASAMEALKVIAFSPAERGGKPVKSRLLVEIEYKLVDPKTGVEISRPGLVIPRLLEQVLP